MTLPATVYFESWDVNNRLADLRLEERFLRRSVDAGFAAWASCTANHPPSSPGYFAWAEAVRTLREQLTPSGWERLNEANLPLVVSSDRKIAISVSAGDEDTGRKDGHPSTRSAKGPRTIGVVQANQRQEFLFPEMALPSEESLKIAGRTTWILLMARDKDAQEVRSELSRPIGMAQDGHVDVWAERIILGATRFDGIDTSGILGDGNGPQSPEIIVQINKRG